MNFIEFLRTTADVDMAIVAADGPYEITEDTFYPHGAIPCECLTVGCIAGWYCKLYFPHKRATEALSTMEWDSRLPVRELHAICHMTDADEAIAALEKLYIDSGIPIPEVPSEA